MSNAAARAEGREDLGDRLSVLMRPIEDLLGELERIAQEMRGSYAPEQHLRSIIRDLRPMPARIHGAIVIYRAWEREAGA